MPVWYLFRMGARRHGQEGALAPPLWKCCKMFCALVVTAKRSVGELFMYYFHNQSSASGGLTPTVNPSLDPTGGLSSRPLICPLRKKSCGRPCCSLPLFSFPISLFLFPSLPFHFLSFHAFHTFAFPISGFLPQV